MCSVKNKVLLVMTQEQRSVVLDKLDLCATEVLVASDRKQAQQILENGSADAIITGTEVPGGNWRQVLEDAAQRQPAAPVLVCLSSLDPGLWLDALEAGAFDVLVEPFQETEVRRIVQGALFRNQPPDKSRASTGPPPGVRVQDAA